eukprot:TRINITY_DN60705_c0_g1_i1.p1 TRINITY_DN60705_c0_g1~~TRINITY_DN60705_c0_g1_i1.p1  ORF type:complete len:651 (+),score=58.46 TRINITY_DN60705_c0_g1_i1:39-1991(+)
MGKLSYSFCLFYLLGLQQLTTSTADQNQNAGLLQSKCGGINGFDVWYSDALQKVYLDTAVPTNTMSTIQLDGATNEHIPIQIVLSNSGATTKSIKDVFINITNPTPGIGYDLSQVFFTNVTIAASKKANPRLGLFPDPLLPQHLAHVHSGMNVPVWVSFFLQPMTSYVADSTVTTAVQQVTGNKATTLCTFEVAIHRYNFAIPTASNSTQETSSSYGDEKIPYSDIEVVRKWYKDMADHRVTGLLFHNIHPEIGVVGWNKQHTEVTLNFTQWDKIAHYIVYELGMRKIMLPAPEGTTFRIGPGHKILPTDVWRFGGHEVPIFKKQMPLEFNPQFVTEFKDMYGKIISHLESKGWLDKHSPVQIYGEWKDEPTFTDPTTLKAWIMFGKLYRSLHPNLKLYQTRFPVPPEPSIYPYVDHFCAHVEQWDNKTARMEMAKLRQSNGVELSIYDNGIPIIDLSWIRMRSFAWAVWDSQGLWKTDDGLQGSLSWYSISSWGRDPWTHANAHSNLPLPTAGAGFGFEVYPNPKPNGLSKYGPVDSIRWQLFRKGVEDTEYFYKLQAMLKQVKTLRDSLDSTDPLFQRVVEVLQKGEDVLDEVEKVVWKPAVSWRFQRTMGGYGNNAYTTNITLVHTVRQKIADHIEATSGLQQLLGV